MGRMGHIIWTIVIILFTAGGLLAATGGSSTLVPPQAEEKRDEDAWSKKDVYELERELRWIEELISRERKGHPERAKHKKLDLKMAAARRELNRLEKLLQGPNDDEVKPQIEQQERILRRLRSQYGGRLADLMSEREEILRELKRRSRRHR